jgi:hypothetical protein
MPHISLHFLRKRAAKSRIFGRNNHKKMLCFSGGTAILGYGCTNTVCQISLVV